MMFLKERNTAPAVVSHSQVNLGRYSVFLAWQVMGERCANLNGFSVYTQLYIGLVHP